MISLIVFVVNLQLYNLWIIAIFLNYNIIRLVLTNTPMGVTMENETLLKLADIGNQTAINILIERGVLARPKKAA